MKTAYINGQVYTGTLPLQQAFLVQDGTFAAVGSNEEMLALDIDRIEDLGNRFVCAGFNDSHMHLLNLGQALTVAPLHLYTRSLQQMLQTLRKPR